MIKNIFLAGFLLTCFFNLKAQFLEIGAGIGIMNYQGDLQKLPFTFNLSQGSLSGYLKYDLANKFVIRGGLTMGSVYADDKFTPSFKDYRNLNFRSKIKEAQFGLEYHLAVKEEHRFSPYIFVCIAAFHFNPYTYDSSGRLVNLRNLSTEGEGLPEYPDRKIYNLNQLSVPFGFGIQYMITNNLSIGVEHTERKTFTDYLDDDSKTYIDYNTLLKEKGPFAVQLSYRGTGKYGPNDLPTLPRGNPKNKDWYYTTMVVLTYHFGGRSDKGEREQYSSGRKGIYGCPKF